MCAISRELKEKKVLRMTKLEERKAKSRRQTSHRGSSGAGRKLVAPMIITVKLNHRRQKVERNPSESRKSRRRSEKGGETENWEKGIKGIRTNKDILSIRRREV